jgi:hypothetical protein
MTLYNTYNEGKQTFVFLEGMSYLQNVSVITISNTEQKLIKCGLIYMFTISTFYTWLCYCKPIFSFIEFLISLGSTEVLLFNLRHSILSAPFPIGFPT